MSLTISVDFDGTLVEDNEPLRWRPGAREAIGAFVRAGHRLILHSCRCNVVDPAPVIDEEVTAFCRTGAIPARVTDQWRLYASMRDFLQREGVWGVFEPWTHPGKPIADVYIDDRMEAPYWPRLTAELGA